MGDPYRVRIVETPEAFVLDAVELWVILDGSAGPSGTSILRAPVPDRAAPWWEDAPPAGQVWDVPPTLRIPRDALPALRAELDRILTGRLDTADTHAARAETLREALDHERDRVDQLLSTLLDQRRTNA